MTTQALHEAGLTEGFGDGCQGKRYRAVVGILVGQAQVVGPAQRIEATFESVAVLRAGEHDVGPHQIPHPQLVAPRLNRRMFDTWLWEWVQRR